MKLTTSLGSGAETWMRASIYTFTMAAGLLLGTPAWSQTALDIIGPHEYDLPVNFDPFNVFVQYAYVQNNSEFWDSEGNNVDGPGSRNTVGFSKFVHFWTPNFNRNIGLAWEVIVPEISIRNRGAVDPGLRNLSGIGDPITGFATWFKPTPQSTLGIQSFLQVPWGDKDVSDTNWKNLTSLLWYTPLIWEFDWTGDAGFIWQSPRVDGITPGTLFHTNNRFGYRVNKWLEPFLGLDYEHVDSFNVFPESWAVDGGVGLMVFTYEGQSITMRYSNTLTAKNHTDTNSWNLKYVYTW
jgi:hypothetical protein